MFMSVSKYSVLVYELLKGFAQIPIFQENIL